MIKKYALFILCVSQMYASVFDWFSTLTPKAKRAELLMQDFDPIVEKAINDFNVPGIAIGVVVDGHLVYAKGFGLRDIEKKLPVTPNTVFAIGSCTKAFTSFVLGTLVDDGLMHWNDRVVDVLSDFRLWDQYATQNLTLRDILTHRSGMPRHDFMWYNSSMTRAEVMERLRYLEPSCDIRERYQYGNLMYLTAGYAMEQATELSWEELVKQRILDPLGMHRTNFTPEDLMKLDDHAVGYLEKDDALKRMSFRDISAIGPAGSMNSSITDLSKWVMMHLDDGVFEGKTLISPATLQEIHSPQVIVTGAPESKETLLSAYGIGWNVSAYRGEYCVSHDGGVEGATSVVAILPYKNIGVIVLANKNLTCLSRYISFQVIDRVLELPPIDWLKEGLEGVMKSKETAKQNKLKHEQSRKKGTSPSHALEDYVGDYSHPGYGKISIKMSNGKLEACFNGITSFLNHWHYDVFSIVEESEDLLISREGMKFTFRNNVNGDVSELIIPFEANASDIVFKKVALESLSDVAYLRQFTGFYEIYGYTVEIGIKHGGLYAMIPGQPIYELVPSAENEFIVKSLAGYSVRFVPGANGKVEEVLLVQPYGALVAKPRGIGK